jgi:LacI family transcriptional regulator
VAEERRGYRVLGRANDPDKGCPFAFVFSTGYSPDWYLCRVLAELQRAAARRRWSLLGVSLDEQSVGEVTEHLRATRACGAIIDGGDAQLLDQVQRLGIPAVLAETRRQDMRLDAIVQDGMGGGTLAGEYLAGRGHKRVAYVGRTLRTDSQAVERFSGAVGGLASGGTWLSRELYAEIDGFNLDDAERRIRALLSMRRRPTAFLALWQGLGAAVVRVAAELGLAVGRDLEVVSWSTEEDYGDRFAPTFPGGKPPPAVVWSVAELAEMAVSRLMQRRAAPRMPTVTIRIPMRLRLP